MRLNFTQLMQPPYLFWTILTFVFVILVFGLFTYANVLYKKDKNNEKADLLYYTTFIILLAYFVRFFFFNYPFSTFWDENYHVASAQKYIDHVFFMEPHPPLGKMVIALGESIFNPNAGIDRSSFDTTDYIKDFPNNFSFFGVRFFPTLFSFLSVILFFFILYSISKKPLHSFLFTFFYLFENGSVMHMRSAMLEGTQFFFIFLTVLYFIMLFQRQQKSKPWQYGLLGVYTGLALSVKLNSLVLILLFLYLIMKEYWPNIKTLDFKKILNDKKIPFNWNLIKEILIKLAASAIGLIAIFSIIFYIHIALGAKTPESRFYNASAEYKAILAAGQTANPANLIPLMLEHIAYTSHYEKGVPVWDPTKADENGSPAFLWPFGYKSINYRWSKLDKSVSYFYYVINPMIWYGGLIAFLLGLSLILSHFAFGLKVRNRNLFNLIMIFTSLYGAYMAAVLTIKRVMYIYHYLVGLYFAVIMIYLVYLYIFEESLKNNNKILYWATIIFALEVVAVFAYFSPFTYGFPLETSEFVKRMWFSIWDLKYINF